MGECWDGAAIDGDVACGGADAAGDVGGDGDDACEVGSEIDELDVGGDSSEASRRGEFSGDRGGGECGGSGGEVAVEVAVTVEVAVVILEVVVVSLDIATTTPCSSSVLTIATSRSSESSCSCWR